MVSIEIDNIIPPAPPEFRRGGCGSCGGGGSGDEDSRCGNGLEKIYPTTAVRFGYMKHIGEFSYPPGMRFTCGAKVVIQTRRGLEIGDQVSLTCSGCDKSVTREQMKSYADASGPDTMVFDAGRIVREATMADLSELARLQAAVSERRRFCQDLANQMRLELKVVECEILFGGERIIFYFMAEGRVDFRQLVRELSSEFQTRIEMRQIGARDEARLLADFETCGREVCCKVFLKDLKPISMKMAKLQKATIDPTKVSGRCGRLKCCLRYEHTTYEELDRQLPRMGARVSSPHGDGIVINRQILTQLLQIRRDDDTIVTIVREDAAQPERKSGPTRSARSEERRSRQQPRPSAGGDADAEIADPVDSVPGEPGAASDDGAGDGPGNAGTADRGRGPRPPGRRRRWRRRSGGGQGGSTSGE